MKNKNELVNLLWDELRLQCCASKLEAKTIIQLKKHDVFKVVDKLIHENKLNIE